MKFYWVSSAGKDNAFRPFLGALIIQVCVSLAFWFAPIIVGALADHWLFTLEQLGWVTAADLIGILIGSLFALHWIYRVNWRLVITLLLPISLFSNLLSAVCDDLVPLLALRVMAGMVTGSVMAITSTIIGGINSPERNFALFVGLQSAIIAIGLLALPILIAFGGVAGAYYMLAALSIVACCFVAYIPRQRFVAAPSSASDSYSDNSSQVNPMKFSYFRFLVLITLPGFLFHAGVSASWTYIERIGVQAGVNPEAIAPALSVSMIAAIAGSLAAIFLAQRWGRQLPLTIALCLQCFALYILIFQLSDATTFQIAVLSLSFCFNFVVGYHLGLAISLDRSGLAPIVYLVMVKLGMALGPLLASVFVSQADLRPALWLSAGFYGASCLYCLWLSASNGKLYNFLQARLS